MELPRKGQEPVASITRRSWLRGGAGLAAGAATGFIGAVRSSALAKEPGRAVKTGRVKQSVCFWCFNASRWRWDIEKTIQVSKDLGVKSVELGEPEDWPTLKKHGFTCAIALNGMGGAPFVKGLNNPRYQPEVIATTKKTIDACAGYGFPSVIAFTGYKWLDVEDPKKGEIPKDEGADNCVHALKALAGQAEKKGVTVCLEMLNTRDDTHPMKGHPGYQGDDLDYCAEIVRRVGSPRVKLLFDIYHVQIMHGDVIRRLGECRELIGHVHTAGNPGRGELDANQEISYPAVMRALVALGYDGYVGQEFIPTRDPVAGLREAVSVCDV